jgi:hypothetical protein
MVTIFTTYCIISIYVSFYVVFLCVFAAVMLNSNWFPARRYLTALRKGGGLSLFFRYWNWYTACCNLFLQYCTRRNENETYFDRFYYPSFVIYTYELCCAVRALYVSLCKSYKYSSLGHTFIGVACVTVEVAAGILQARLGKVFGQWWSVRCIHSEIYIKWWKIREKVVATGDGFASANSFLWKLSIQGSNVNFFGIASR